MEQTTDEKIKILQARISVEHDLTKREELNKQLRKLQLEKEINVIKKKMDYLS